MKNKFKQILIFRLNQLNFFKNHTLQFKNTLFELNNIFKTITFNLSLSLTQLSVMGMIIHLGHDDGFFAWNGFQLYNSAGTGRYLDAVGRS